MSDLTLAAACGVLKRPARRFLVLLALVPLATGPVAACFDSCRAADVTGDGAVGIDDWIQVQAALGTATAREDLDGDGMVTDVDLRWVRSYAPSCPEPDHDEICGNRPCVGCVADVDQSATIDEADLQAVADGIGTTVDCHYDVNRDGRICPWDLFVASAYLNVPYSQAAARVDFNRDGEVDHRDLQLLDDVVPEQPPTDGYDNTCRRDLDRNGAIEVNDRWPVLAATWGPCGAFARGPGKPDACDTKDIDPLVAAGSGRQR